MTVTEGCMRVWPLPEGSNGTPVCCKERHLSNLLYWYVGIYLLIIEPVCCATGIWLRVFEVKHVRMMKE